MDYPAGKFPSASGIPIIGSAGKFVAEVSAKWLAPSEAQMGLSGSPQNSGKPILKMRTILPLLADSAEISALLQ